MVYVGCCFPFTPIIIKLHTKTLLELRIFPFYFGVKKSKVKVAMNWFLKMVFVHNCFPLTPKHHRTSHTYSPWVEDVSYWCQGHNVRGQGHNALITENGFWLFHFTSAIIKLHTHIPSESRVCPNDNCVKFWFCIGCRGGGYCPVRTAPF